MSEDTDQTTQSDAPKLTAAQKRDLERQARQREPRFDRDRLLGSAGPAIVTSAYDDAPPPFAAEAGTIAGALHDRDFPEDGMTRTEIRNAVDEYLSSVDTSNDADDDEQEG